MAGSGSRVVPVALVAIAVLLAASGASAGWGPDGITVRETAVDIPMVVACSDGGSGTLVAWQEMASKRAGFLRVQHVLATGDIDPAWPPEGALASSVATNRTFLDLVPDRLGGAYVAWVEIGVPRSLFVTRLDAGGQVAAGWPETGRLLGAANVYLGRPAAIEDGAHGLYVAWTSGSLVYVERFGPDGHGAGGWLDGPRVVTSIGSVPLVRLWPALTLAPDGGAFVGWATLSRDTTMIESGVYLRRITGAGANVPGWLGGGRRMAALRPEFLAPELPQAPLSDIAADGQGGVFWFGGGLWGPSVEPRLEHLLGNGTPAPGWAAEGRAAPPVERYGDDPSPATDFGLRVHADGRGGAIVEERSSAPGSPPVTMLYGMSDAGLLSGPITGVAAGHEVVVKGDGGVFLAQFVPHGRYDPGDPDAFLEVSQSSPPAGWTSWRETHTESVPWYGDIALAPAGNDGVVFFWSQVQERTGLFARRFTSDGQVTGVGPTSAGAALHRLRFVSGAGVVAQVTLEGRSGTLELFDIAGRRVAGCAVEGSGTNQVDVTLPGTASLVSGIYLVHLAAERGDASGKVAVVR